MVSFKGSVWDLTPLSLTRPRGGGGGAPGTAAGRAKFWARPSSSQPSDPGRHSFLARVSSAVNWSRSRANYEVHCTKPLQTAQQYTAPALLSTRRRAGRRLLSLHPRRALSDISILGSFLVFDLTEFNKPWLSAF